MIIITVTWFTVHVSLILDGILIWPGWHVLFVPLISGVVLFVISVFSFFGSDGEMPKRREILARLLLLGAILSILCTFLVSVFAKLGSAWQGDDPEVPSLGDEWTWFGAMSPLIFSLGLICLFGWTGILIPLCTRENWRRSEFDCLGNYYFCHQSVSFLIELCLFVVQLILASLKLDGRFDVDWFVVLLPTYIGVGVPCFGCMSCCASSSLCSDWCSERFGDPDDEYGWLGVGVVVMYFLRILISSLVMGTLIMAIQNFVGETKRSWILVFVPIFVLEGLFDLSFLITFILQLFD